MTSPEGIDIGVRSLVAWLNAEAFCTIDSGDGISKADAINAGEALPHAHVFIAVDPIALVTEALRLRFALALRGVELQEIGGDVPSVQATYGPVTGNAIIALLHVDDFVLGGAPRA